ncbi:GNAT family N-acetyltransferase [Kitasatospora sp. GAS204B]|uniref:GNAT family N-acetyltransferase n=1 Tax=unclassified Kitasatospora TaxID=2633591 RepID=UPI002476B6A8|nr:GNAT family N-acetyltransferase [Kitasatospora sp. GAS204B]
MDVRSAFESERESFLRTLLAAFGQLPQPPAQGQGGWWYAYEMDRNLFAERDGVPIGTAGAYSFELTLPGGPVAPVAGVTAVGVLPTHRRQGVLTALMRHQLDQLCGQGEFLAVLIASEALIYRRFGYGPATFRQRLTVPRHRAAVAGPAVPGSIELRERAGSAELLAEIYDRYRRTQPGELSRPAHWWALGAGQPPVSLAPRHLAVHRDPSGTADGYASYLVGPTDPVSRTRELTVDEIVAVDSAAHRALVRYCLSHDLVHRVVLANLPPENDVRWQLADHRGAQLTEDQDALWLRLLDVPRALTARRYLADGRLVLDVLDPFRPATGGRYELTVTPDGARCEPTEREPDLTLDISDLASLYLGGVAAGALVRAGRIRAHHPRAAARADALFRTERPPHCLHAF